ncbi:MAG: NfeD family protein [Gemmatimonadales bacterium]
MRQWFLATLLAGSMLAPEALRAQQAVVYRIPVTGVIELGIAPFIRRALREAEAAGARAAILDINTLGGRVDAALVIVDAVTGTRIPVYAFIDPRAISAGALIAMASDSIFMSPEASFGASTVVDAEGAKVSEKAQSVMRAQFRALAERRGLDPRVAESMVDETLEVEGVVEVGRLLTLTASEAERIGYALEVADFDDLLDRLDIGRAEIVTPRTNWAEGLVRFLSNPIVAPLLLSIGVLGVIVEIKTPSFGLAGAVGLASLAAFFGSHLLIGLAGWEEIILLGAGMVALGLEVFVIPGFGLAGVVALLCIGAAIFLALIGNLPTWADIARASGILTFTAILITAMVYTLVRRLPTSARWQGIFLQAATTRDEGYVSGDTRADLIGHTGIAATDLRPGGTVVIAGERLDVVCETGYVPKGARVKVVRADGYRLVVASI